MVDKFSKRNLEILTGIAMGKFLEASEHDKEKEILIVNRNDVTYYLKREKRNWIISVNFDELLPNYVIAELRDFPGDEHATVIKEITSIIRIYDREVGS